MIFDRLQRNLKRLKPFVDRQRLEAYRLYDWDIPEYPCFVDSYKDQLVVSDRSRPNFERDQKHVREVLHSLQELFPDMRIHHKERRVQTRQDKYQKINSKNRRFVVQEGDLKFLVNATDYLDTGLFLDHRPLRQWIQQDSKDKKVLNLFCYTGAISVAAAKGGAWVTSIDLSKTYLEWAQDNFELNGIDPNDHRFFRDDVCAYLRKPPTDRYDVIVLDPPTFSNSKKMSGHFDVQADHEWMVKSCLERLNPKGILYFSNNREGFRLSKEILERCQVTDITEKSIPFDFHRGKVHCCYKISAGN